MRTLTRFDWCCVYAGLFVTAIWIFKRDWLEQPRSNQRIKLISLAMAVIGTVGLIGSFLGRKTFVHCLIFPAILLYIHNWLFSRFQRRHGRIPQDTFLLWRRGLEPDYVYNGVFAVLATVIPAVGGVLIYLLATR